jgi:hypothetical protein
MMRRVDDEIHTLQNARAKVARLTEEDFIVDAQKAIKRLVAEKTPMGKLTKWAHEHFMESIISHVLGTNVKYKDTIYAAKEKI